MYAFTICEFMKSSVVPWLFTLLAAAMGQAPANEIYNLDFTPPETGSYQTIFGQPAIQGVVGPFEDAMTFRAVTSYEQIRLNIGNVARQYDIQYDALVHNLTDSQYHFSIHLDYDINLTKFQVVSFHGGLNSIYTFSPFQPGSGSIESFANDQVYHFRIQLDFDAQLWSLDIDGVRRFSSGIDGLNLESIRFTTAPWIGGAVNAPASYAAIDNVVVTAIPEPSILALVTLGSGAMAFFRNKRRNSLMLD
jgi:hypothetical protein